MKQQKKPLTHNDGIVTIYRTENTAAAGETPCEILIPMLSLCYQQRTVGVKRHYAAMQAGELIDLLLRVPLHSAVSVQDIAIPTLDRRQYRISVIQYIQDTLPPVMDLTLRRLDNDYPKQT